MCDDVAPAVAAIGLWGKDNCQHSIWILQTVWQSVYIIHIRGLLLLSLQTVGCFALRDIIDGIEMLHTGTYS